VALLCHEALPSSSTNDQFSGSETPGGAAATLAASPEQSYVRPPLGATYTFQRPLIPPRLV
jgi:hypothetical protein